MRPIYLVSKTPYPGVNHIPILVTNLLHFKIDFLQYDGVIITSKEGINSILHLEHWKKLPLICVSKKTAEYAHKHGAKNIIIADGYGESIPTYIKQFPKNMRWVYIRAKVIASDWTKQESKNDFILDECITYETFCNEVLDIDSIEENAILIFTSPSSVECYKKRFSFSPKNTLIAIGKTTKKSLEGLFEVYLSSEQSIESSLKLAKSLI